MPQPEKIAPATKYGAKMVACHPGTMLIASAVFDGAATPAAGNAVYISETNGKLTVVAPNNPLTVSSVQKVGMVLSANAGVYTVLVQIGDLTILNP